MTLSSSIHIWSMEKYQILRQVLRHKKVQNRAKNLQPSQPQSTIISFL